MGNLIKETPYSEITATLEIFDRYGIRREHFTKLRSDADYAKRVAESVLATSAAQNLYSVTVDHSRTVEEMVAAGKCDWSNSDISSKHFPSDKKGKVEVNIELVHFNRTMESDEVLRELDKQDLRPATLPELLAFGATYPDKQREFPIVALGSVWRGLDGDRVVACLYGNAGDRGLGLDWFVYGWGDDCRFAAVRK
jgi:hypothetical protein